MGYRLWGVKRVRHDLVTNQQLLESLAEAQGSHEVWGGKVEATQTRQFTGWAGLQPL